VARRVLPAVLVFAALLSDVFGGHGVALAFLLVAIPAAFALALDCFGDALESRCGGARPILAGLAVFLLVVSASLRSPAVVGGVPQFAVSALVFALCLYGGVAVGAILPAGTARRARFGQPDVRQAYERRRRAA
jgi:hypothetical protein